MKTVRTPEALKEALKSHSGSIGFVPTMGALHSGHRTLIEEARAHNDIVVVSIFVNPTQFLEGEDLGSYPRREAADHKVCELSGVDYLFYPEADVIYGDDEIALKAPDVRGFILEGASRPGHFDGMLTVVMKLLNMVAPTRAYFGKKDAQQLLLIEQMVRNFFMDVEIVPVNTVREDDGLALSSRNVYLSSEERTEALKLSHSLKRAGKMVMQGDYDVENIKTQMLEKLQPLKVEYVAIVDREFRRVDKIQKDNTLILVAARVGTTRLIDNLWI